MENKRNNPFCLVPVSKINTFTTIEGNRKINPRHVEELKQQVFINAELIPPVIINRDTNHVIDGQHRIEAYKQAALEGMIAKDAPVKVMFVCLSEDEEKRCMIDANIHAKQWKQEDYINYYMQSNPAYMRLSGWCMSKPLMMIHGKPRWNCGAAFIKGKTCKQDVKAGKLTITDEEIAVANKVYDEVEAILQAIDVQPGDSILLGLGVVWHRYRQYHDFQAWLNTFRKNKGKIQKESKTYVNDWERILSGYHMKMEQLEQKHKQKEQ